MLGESPTIPLIKIATFTVGFNEGKDSHIWIFQESFQESNSVMLIKFEALCRKNSGTYVLATFGTITTWKVLAVINNSIQVKSFCFAKTINKLVKTLFLFIQICWIQHSSNSFNLNFSEYKLEALAEFCKWVKKLISSTVFWSIVSLISSLIYVWSVVSYTNWQLCIKLGFMKLIGKLHLMSTLWLIN